MSCQWFQLLFPPQIKANTPILLCSVTGYDASHRVDDLAAQQSKQCTSIAIGQHLFIHVYIYTRVHCMMCVYTGCPQALPKASILQRKPSLLPPSLDGKLTFIHYLFLFYTTHSPSPSLTHKHTPFTCHISLPSPVLLYSWVLLKNVHLAPQWLVQLEKKLHSLTPNPNFRLFLTMEINPKV